MKEFKTAAASWVRGSLTAVIALYMAGETDPKKLLNALIAGCLPPLLRYLNPNDPALGVKKDA